MIARVILAMVAFGVAAGSSIAAPAAVPGSDVFTAYAGHWNCPVTHRERSYVIFGNEMFDRAFQRDGDDQLERFTVGPKLGDFVELASEGEGTGTFRDDGTLVMSGFTHDQKTPVTITTRIDGNTLTRQVARGGSASFEMCNREIPPAPGPCKQPDRAAGVVYTYPPRRSPVPSVNGYVYVRLLLDNRSNVIWSDIVKSLNADADEIAVESTHKSKFRAPEHNCVAVPGQFIFTVGFGDPQ